MSTYYTAQEAADQLGIEQSTVRRWCRRLKIQPVKGRWLLTARQIAKIPVLGPGRPPADQTPRSRQRGSATA